MRTTILSIILFFFGVVSVIGQSSDRNYVTETIAREEFKGAISGLSEYYVNKTITYYDGLGRPLQVVNQEASPDRKDVISPVVYDSYGRQEIKFLSYESSGTGGQYRAGWESELGAFYSNTSNQTVDESSYYYSQMEYEASPLNRVAKVLAPGSAWVGADRGQTTSYWVNSDNEVFRFYVASDDDQIYTEITDYYPAGDLYVTTNIDENGSKVVEYMNKQGQVVCNKAYLTVSESADSYYIYDDFGLLRYVVQPEGVVEMGSDLSKLNDYDFRSEWLFQYTYDNRKRMISKQVPGVETVYMIYDNRDRLVLTQGGNQRGVGILDIGDDQYETSEYEWTNYEISSNGSVTLTEGFSFTASDALSFEVGENLTSQEGSWIYTKYDLLDRPVMTGEISTLTGSREEIQLLVDNGVYDFTTTYEGNTSNDLYGYAYSIAPGASVLNVTYYDDYSFLSDLSWGSDYGYAGYNNKLKGVVTGGLTRIIGSDMMKSINYYDSRLRSIYSVQQNHLGGTDEFITEYANLVTLDILSTTRNHTRNTDVSVSKTIVTEYEYDHVGRLLYTRETIDGNRSTVTNTYNEIGELISEDLNGSQTVDYSYNIRGWLKTINDGTSLGGSDVFGMELFYDDASNTTNKQYNGNISQINWKTLGGVNDNAQTYAYTYDGLNRLKKADYTGGNYNVWGSDAGGIAYDLNGNIKNLKRNSSGVEVDHLSYEYKGNQLLSVGDDGTDDLFIDGNTSGNDYVYDGNGNMIIDRNKGISSISYNYLNLPEQVERSGVGSLSYTYLSDGTKIQKQFNTGANTTNTHYVAGIQYTGQTLGFVQTTKGRYDFISGFQYDLKDHLGNVRATLGQTTVPSGTDFETYEYDLETGDPFFYYSATFSTASAKSGSRSIVVSDQVITSSSPSLVKNVSAGDLVSFNVWASSGYNSGRVVIDFKSSNSIITTLQDQSVELPTGSTWVNIKLPNSEVPEDGTIHIYFLKVSSYSDVYFDDIYLDIESSREAAMEVIQVQDYYPFGLTFNSNTGESVIDENQYKFTGKEGQEGTDWIDFGARMYDPELGRWNHIDPLTENYFEKSPYNYALNNPIKYVDPDGRDVYVIIDGRAVLSKKEGGDHRFVDNNTGKDVDPNGKNWASVASALNEADKGDNFSLEDLGDTDQAKSLRSSVGRYNSLGLKNSFNDNVDLITGIGGIKQILKQSYKWVLKQFGDDIAIQTAKSVDDKLAKYLLNPNHAVGKSKAAFFERALGFTTGNSDQLAKQIVFNSSTAVQTAVTKYGTKFSQTINIVGANGRKIDVTFAWIKNNDGVVRLVTGYPAK